MSDINIGALSEAINDKMDRDLNNRSTDSGLRKLVESYVNGTSWYKIFDEIQSDGTVKKWCEQGGRTTSYSGAGYETITLLKPMADVNYTLLNCNNSAAARGDQRDAYIISTTQIGVGYDNSQSGGAIWKVEGYIS